MKRRQIAQENPKMHNSEVRNEDKFPKDPKVHIFFVFTDLQKTRIWMENLNRSREKAFHWRSQKNSGEAHAGPSWLQIPATKKTEKPKGTRLSVHHALPISTNGSTESW